MNRNVVGERIRSLRKKCGYTQEALAEKAGIARGSIGRYETGVFYPSQEVIVTLASIFHVSTDYLLGNETTKQDDDSDIWELREALRRDPDRRMLFDAAKNVSKKDILTAVKILDALKGNDEDGDC